MLRSALGGPPILGVCIVHADHVTSQGAAVLRRWLSGWFPELLARRSFGGWGIAGVALFLWADGHCLGAMSLICTLSHVCSMVGKKSRRASATQLVQRAPRGRLVGVVVHHGPIQTSCIRG